MNSSTSTPSQSNGTAPVGPEGNAPLPPPLFYSRPLPLSAEYHATFKIRPPTDYGFAATTNVVPLAIPEFVMAARNYPIIFVGEDLIPSAAVGLRPGDNLFVDVKGAWETGQYIPAYVRRYPFILLGAAADERLRLGIDDDARSTKDGAQALFENGKETEVVRQSMGLCEQFHGAFKFGIEFVQAIKDANITESRTLEIELPDGEKLNVGNFIAVNEDKFRAVPDATFLEWRTKGWVHPIYFHLQSLNNWEALMARTAQRLAAASTVR